jgi:prepilin signal peptidase PulO-like enzyme (type II secretory pathway)
MQLVNIDFGVPLPIILIGLLAGGTRAFLAADPPTLRTLLGTILASLFLAIVLYPLLADEEYGTGLVTFLVAIGSFTAVDSLPILPKLLQQIKKDPFAILREYLAFRYGAKKPDEDDKP